MSKLIFVPLVVAAAVIGCNGVDKPKVATGPTVHELTILGAYEDGASHDPFSKPRPSFHDVLDRIWDASHDDEVRGLLLHLGAMPGAWGRVRDLAEAVSDFRNENRPVHCHFETADNVAYLLLASACDYISMSPAGTLDLIGPAAVMFYAKSFLENVGVKADILHMGRYKGAGDMLIRDSMPPEAKESMDAILDDLYSSVAAAVTARTETSDAQTIIDSGPYTSQTALDAKLVDSVDFLLDARERIKKAASVEEVERVRMMPSAEDVTLREVLSVLSQDQKDGKEKGTRLALVYVNGNIVEAQQTRLGQAPSGPFVKAVRRLAEDDDVKAVVLRINSPGGSALASDRMWNAVRALAQKKPVIASVADMAASGGYYIASAAQKIMAHPNSLVGSIGVVGGKISIGPLAEDLGISPVVLQRGKRAAWATPVRALSDTEREAFQVLLEDTYKRFIDRVATGREMERDAVLAAAEGRVMTGQDGKAFGLIDEIGGLSAALGKAKAAAKLPDDAKIEIWPPRQGVLDALSDVLGGGEDVGALAIEPYARLLFGSQHTATAQVRALRDMLVGAEHVAVVPPVVFAVR